MKRCTPDGHTPCAVESCRTAGCGYSRGIALQEENEARMAAWRVGRKPEIRVGHVLDQLALLPAESVSCVVTSPPYWSLRKYAAPDVVWGGDPECDHEWGAVSKEGASVEGYAGKKKWQHSVNGRQEPHPEARHRVDNPEDWTRITRETALCSRCGAWRGQLGLEPSPWLYVEHIVKIMRAVRRVLRKDGVVFLNIGNGYAGSGQGRGSDHGKAVATDDDIGPKLPTPGFKPKDLIPMHAMLELALIQDGWWLRSEIIWHKPNAMPESTRDRPTSAHEYVLLLTRSARYWWDAEAVREPHTDDSAKRYLRKSSYDGTDQKPYAMKNAPTGAGVQKWEAEDSPGPEWVKGHSGYVNADGRVMVNPGGRNIRSVWTFSTAQTPEAHFATFPEELPRRCIEASCPREICTACGTARVRMVERVGLQEHPGRRDRSVRNVADYDGHDYAVRDSTLGLVAEDVTTGWSSCDCGAPFAPGLVLDPFAGTGTTLLVAKRLGRRAIGIELSEEYAAMARAKLAQWWKRTEIREPERDDAQQALPLGGQA